MDPAIAGIIGAAMASLVAGVFALRQTRTVEAEKAKANANTNAMETVKVQIDGWDRLADSYRQEIERLGHALAEERAIAEAFAAAKDRLERENHDLRAQLQERKAGE